MKGHVKPELLSEYRIVRDVQKSLADLLHDEYMHKARSREPQAVHLSSAYLALNNALDAMRVDIEGSEGGD
ncbi:hypothetical protein [Glutamicibacter creatinolyticus]|uniref:hypothetical protein n=1 Tax=Glutamicibacter creatinolyticus TaxID=162496 RepID=UPI00321745E2